MKEGTMADTNEKVTDTSTEKTVAANEPAVAAATPPSTPASSTAQQAHAVFPSVGEFFSASWKLFTQTWIKQFGISFVAGLFNIALTILAVLIVVLPNLPVAQQIIHATQTHSFDWSMIPSSSWLILGIVSAIWVIGLIIVGVSTQVALIRVVNSAYDGQQVAIMPVWKAGWKKVIPLFLVGIITGFFVWGGLGVLIVPGIIFSIWLAYTTMEVIIYDSSVLNAMRESVRLVRGFFWEILGRSVLLFLIFVTVSGVLGKVNSSAGTAPGGAGILPIVNLVVQFVVQYFGVAAGIVLYRQAKAAGTNLPKRGLKGMFIVALIGWVLTIATWGYIASWVKSMAPDIQKAIEQQQQSSQSQNVDQFLMSPPPYGKQYSNINQNNVIINPDVTPSDSTMPSTQPGFNGSTVASPTPPVQY
jgi:hypothetical protein